MERRTRTLNEQGCLPYNDLACLNECPLHSNEVRTKMRDAFAQTGDTYSHGAVELVDEIIAANVAFANSAEVLAQCLLYNPPQAENL